MITCGTQIVSGAPIYGGGGGGDVPSTRTITAGTGLTGGGDLSADRTLAVSFGTTAGTAAQGDDSRLSNARTPTAHAASHGGGGTDPITIASTQVTGLGGAALLSVGTTAGTVAAGDDSRIVNAVPNTRTIATLALSADISVASLNTALGITGTSTAGTRIAAPDTGWTDQQTNGTISRSSSVHTFSNNVNSFVRERRLTISTAECPAVEFIGRFDVTSGVPATDWYTALSLGSNGDSYGYLVQVDRTGSVGLYQAHAGGYVLVATSGAISLTAGNWLRIIVTPSYASASWGADTGGSTPPTLWTTTSTVATTLTSLSGGYLTHLSVRAGRANVGSGTFTTRWRDLQYRILGVAP